MNKPGLRSGSRVWCVVAFLTAAIGAGAFLVPAAAAQQAERTGNLPPLARYFPGQDLVVYVEFDGLDGHNGSWQKTAAYRVLNDTTTGAMYRAALPRIFEVLLSEEPAFPLNGSELTDLVLHLFRSGFAVGINRPGNTGSPRSLALAVRGAGKGETHQLLDRVLRAGATPRSGVRDLPKRGGRTVHQLGGARGRALAWWTEGDDLIISMVSPEGDDVLIDVIEGRLPNAVAHATRAALLRSEEVPGFEPIGLAFFDMAALPPLPREAVSLGLDRIKRFDYRWGVHGDALLSIVGAAAPVPRSGIPALFDQPILDPRKLPPLPGGLADFTVVSLDEAQLAPRLRATLAALVQLPQSPDVAGPDQIAASLREVFGVSLHDDLFAHLGTRFTFFNLATTVNAPSHILESFAQGFLRAPKMALVAEVKHRDPLVKTLEKLIDHANKALRSTADQPNGLSLGSIERLKNGETGYVMSFAGSEIPIANGLRPTLLLGRNTLVLASTPAMARRARDHAESHTQGGLPPGDPLGAKLDWLPGHLTMLSVADTAHSVYPELVVGLPGLVESLLRSQRLAGFPFAMGGSPFQLTPEFFPATVAVAPGQVRTQRTLPPWDAELVPDPDDLRPFLFSSVHALAVDGAGMRFLSREAIPTLNPSTAVPIALAALVPAIRNAQILRDRAQSTNNLKQIGLASATYHDMNNHFPTDIRGKDGKPLLSWRVAILPFLEQRELFNEFRLDEPWDSAHNKALLAKMPPVFALPDPAAEAGNTFYRGFSGAGAMFDVKAPAGVAIADILDGTSNTILVVEAKEEVPWTKPGSDLTFEDDQKPETGKVMLDKLGGHSKGGFNALFCDGAVRFIRSNVSPITLRALITRAAGEVISTDSF